jgi:hypothetical protein
MHFADYSLNINKIVIEALMLAGGIWFKKQAGCEKSVMVLMRKFNKQTFLCSYPLFFFLRVENIIHREGKCPLFICPKVQTYLLHVNNRTG